jgi:hypothetical protein
MAVIAGATYREGVAIHSNGAPYVVGVASGSQVPTTATVTGSGAKPLPLFGIKVNGDGAIYVRYV